MKQHESNFNCTIGVKSSSEYLTKLKKNVAHCRFAESSALINIEMHNARLSPLEKKRKEKKNTANSPSIFPKHFYYRAFHFAVIINRGKNFAEHTRASRVLIHTK